MTVAAQQLLAAALLVWGAAAPAWGSSSAAPPPPAGPATSTAAAPAAPAAAARATTPAPTPARPPPPPAAPAHDNSSAGQLLGDACDKSCSTNLLNVFCDQERHTCECEPHFPVRLAPTVGCAKPVRLGEQCFHDRTCISNEPHSVCVQIHHNAICQCKPGFHVVTVHKPRERVFCSEDIMVIKTDMQTLFGMLAGIAVITGLICFVLKLYSRARYSPPRHYANAGLPPPILFASETGIPLALQRAPSRSSGRYSAPPFSRRPSSSLGLIGGGHSASSRAGAARAAAILLISCHFDHQPVASTSRQADDEDELSAIEQYEMDDIFCSEEEEESPALADECKGRNKFRGSRRPSTASYSSSSSVRSYGVRRLEEENERKYQRQLMKMQSQPAQHQGTKMLLDLQHKGSSPNLISSSSLGSSVFGGAGSFGAGSFGTSCRTPLSIDDLLPSVRELVEPVSQPGSSGSQHKTRTASLQPIIAPSSSSSSEASPLDDKPMGFPMEPLTPQT